LGIQILKKHKRTLKAFSDFLKQTGFAHKLVMLDYNKIELNKIEIDDTNLINHIVLTGYVVNTDLPAIYSQCDIFYILHCEKVLVFPC
jgi:hypothetical protein